MSGYYRDTKDEALQQGAPYSALCTVRAELVPNNGWVTVLFPNSVEALMLLDLRHVLKFAEVDTMGRLRQPPADRKRMPAPVAKPTKSKTEPEEALATWKPSDPLPW